MPQTISNCVQKLREDKNLTQQALGEKTGVTRQTIIALERGNYTPSLLLALNIAQFFNQPIEVIFKINKL